MQCGNEPLFSSIRKCRKLHSSEKRDKIFIKEKKDQKFFVAIKLGTDNITLKRGKNYFNTT